MALTFSTTARSIYEPGGQVWAPTTQLPNTACAPRGVCGKSSSTRKIEKIKILKENTPQIGPSSSSSCNEFPIAVPFFLSEAAIA